MASQMQVVCGYRARHCSAPMHSKELLQRQQHNSTGQEWAAGIACNHAAYQKQLASLTPEQSTPPQPRESSPSEQATDLDATAASQGQGAAASGPAQQQQSAATSFELHNSRSSSETHAGWIQEQAGQQVVQPSTDNRQQQQFAAQQQQQPLQTEWLSAAGCGHEMRPPLVDILRHQHQEQQQPKSLKQALHQRRPKQVSSDSEALQQQIHKANDQRPFGWLRQQAASCLLQALDPVRLPLLQAHSLLGERDTCSQNILAVLGDVNEHVAAAGSSTQLSHCWQRFQSVADAKHAARLQHQKQQEQQQQHQLQQELQAAPHPACEVPKQVAMRQKQHQQHSINQQQKHSDAPPQQQERMKTQILQQHGTRFTQIALAARRASQDGDNRLKAEALAAAKHTAEGSVIGAVRGAAAASAAVAASDRVRARNAAAAALAEAAPSIAWAAAAAAAAALPPKPKPFKKTAKKAAKPWQPKLEPDFQSWRKEKFFSVDRDWAQHQKVCNSKQLKPLPDQDTAVFAMLLLLHGTGWPNALLWQRWQAEHPKGEVALMVHMKAGVDMRTVMHGREAIVQHKLQTQVDARWGDISLVEAQIDSMAEILQRCPHVTHIGLASGHDIPVQLLKPGLLLPGVSMFGMYQFPDKETRCLRVSTYEELRENTGLDESEVQSWSCALMFHHQWMVLSREHAAALVLLKKDLRTVGRVIHNATNSVKAGMAPDEFIMLTALRAHGYVRSIQRVELKPGMQYAPGTLLNSYPTLVLFPAESSPHPVLWTDPHEKQECQVEHNTGQQYFKKLNLMECLKLSALRCAMFFRKVDIRKTRGEELALVMSALDMLWHHRSGSIITKGKRKQGQYRSGSKGPVNQLKEAAAATDDSTPGSSAVDTPADTDGEESETPSKRARSTSAS